MRNRIVERHIPRDHMIGRHVAQDHMIRDDFARAEFWQHDPNGSADRQRRYGAAGQAASWRSAMRFDEPTLSGRRGVKNHALRGRQSWFHVVRVADATLVVGGDVNEAGSVAPLNRTRHVTPDDNRMAATAREHQTAEGPHQLRRLTVGAIWQGRYQPAPSVPTAIRKARDSVIALRTVA